MKMILRETRKSRQKGAMALGSILALSAILLAIGLAMAFSGFIQGDIVFNQDKASSAFYIAEAGVKDAMQKIARNKDYNYASPGYNLIVDGGTATVIVNKDIPVGGKTEIISTGVVGNNTKKVREVLDVGVNGDVTVDTWAEMAN